MFQEPFDCQAVILWFREPMADDPGQNEVCRGMRLKFRDAQGFADHQGSG